MTNPFYDASCEDVMMPKTVGITSMSPDKYSHEILLIVGGEPTMVVTGNGLGGRNQHAALVALEKYADDFNFFKSHEVAFLAAGTDGQDGPTDAAGAVVDKNVASLVIHSEELQSQLSSSIRNCDSYNFFSKLAEDFKVSGDENFSSPHIKCGHTGTNVMDLVFISFAI